MSWTRLLATLLILAGATLASAQRQMEALGRGVVAINQGSGKVYVGWRLLGTDPDELAFNLYRATDSGAPVKLNAAPLVQTTDFVDTSADLTKANAWFVRPVLLGVEQAASGRFALKAGAPVQPYVSVPLQTLPNNIPNDVSVGDLDGDGEYELIVKQEEVPRDNSQSGYTGETKLEAYKLDGTMLWRINLGKNIREGAHYTQFMVYDLDGDGRAEIACKTADGTIDGTGKVIGDANADWRNSAGYVLSGPEYLTIFDGLTGAALATVPYVPGRGNVGDWGDTYGNRVDRFLACVAYLDGRRPSLVMCRGYYTRTTLTAWDWRDGQLTQRWKFDTRVPADLAKPAPGFSNWEDMGNHQLAVADVDDDGRDEILYGALCINSDGTGRYTTGIGHGDAYHVSKMDPDRPGLQVYGPHETPSLYGPHGSEMHDAKTGAVIWSADGQGADVGRGVAFDIDPRYRGYEAWSARGGLYSCKGELITASRPSQMNFGVWWDADPLREILDNVTIYKWDWTTNRSNPIFTATGCASNNGTKATPALSADLFGDWREEVILRTTDNKELRIYTTTIPAQNRLYTLMHDPQYRLAIAWQNTAYNQPPHPGFYLGDGMDRPPTPLIKTTALTATAPKVRLANLSVRTAAGTGDETLIVGFAVAGGGKQNVLLRGVGPTLATYGVTGAMADPKLELYSGSTLLNSNNDWSSSPLAADLAASAAAEVGAFPLPTASRDAALTQSLDTGTYTAHLTAASGSRSVALVELYAAGNNSTTRLTNTSARARTGAGDETLIAGFVIDGAAPKTLLIRVVGPSLVPFGVAGALADPQLTLYRGTTRVASNDNWGQGSGATAAAFAQLGAFALPADSKDAAVLLNLPPGAYTVHATGANATAGVVLIEIYEAGS